MMSNTSNVAASTNLNTTGAPAGLVSSHPLTSTGLPLTSAPHLGLTNVNNNNTLTHTGIAPLAGADAMIAPVASHITLPAPVLAPGQAPALLHGGSTTTLGQTATPMLGGEHLHHTGSHHHTGMTTEHHGHHATPMMTTGAPLATGAPITQSLPMQQTQQPLMTGAALPQTTTTHTTTTGVQPTMITTTTDKHHGHHDAHTDKELMKEREKESHRLAKEQEKLAKERAKEQKKHEKEEEKMLKKQEKEHLKHEKELEKEHKKHEKELAKEHRHGHHDTTHTTTQPLATKPGMMAAPIQPAVLPAGAVVLPTYAGSGLPVAAGQGYANPLLTDAQAAAVEIAKVNQLNTAYQQPIAGTTMGTGMHAAPITTTTTTTTQPSAMHTAPRY